MSDTYTTYGRCPYCGEFQEDITYHPDSKNEQLCTACHKRFKVILDIVPVKIDN